MTAYRISVGKTQERDGSPKTAALVLYDSQASLHSVSRSSPDKQIPDLLSPDSSISPDSEVALCPAPSVP